MSFNADCVCVRQWCVPYSGFSLFVQAMVCSDYGGVLPAGGQGAGGGAGHLAHVRQVQRHHREVAGNRGRRDGDPDPQSGPYVCAGSISWLPTKLKTILKLFFVNGKQNKICVVTLPHSRLMKTF